MAAIQQGAGGSLCREDSVKKGDFLAQLDNKSRRLVWMLACQRHASIEELASGIAAENHFEVLRRLVEVINPAAVQHFGRPVIEFRNKMIDPLTGEAFFFHWWYTLEESTGTLPLVDVIDEGDYLAVLVQVPPDSRAEKVRVRLNNGILEIRLPRTNQPGVPVS